MAEDSGRILTKGMISEVCIDWQKKAILTIRNNSDPKKPLGFVGLPGGKMKEGETPEEAVCRELRQETSQEGKAVMKYVIEIPKRGSEGDYIHYFIIVKIVSTGIELKNNEDPRDIPAWIPLQEIIRRRTKMFRGHIQGLFMLLEKIVKTEEQKTGNKVNKHGIKIISEGKGALFETFEALKDYYTQNGHHFGLPRHLWHKD